MTDVIGHARDGEDAANARGPTGAATPSAAPDPPDPQDETIPPEMRLPAGTFKSTLALRLRDTTALLWAIFLLLLSFVPSLGWWEWSVKALDALLWPIIAACGRWWGVIVLSLIMAAGSILVQYLVTDIKRLREVRRRVDLLRTAAAKVPLHSPRDNVLTREAHRGARQVAGASLVSLAVLLGPMVLLFLWLPERVDWENPIPGTSTVVIAAVEPTHTGIVEIHPPEKVALRESDDSQTTRLATAENPRLVSWAVAPDEAGAWPVKVQAGTTPDAPTTTVSVLAGAIPPPLGAKVHPRGHVVNHHGQSPIREVAVLYLHDPMPPFWRPFGFLGWQWDAGWIGLCMVVSFPLMLALRWVMQIP